MESSFAKRFIAGILILAQFAGVVRAQTVRVPTPNEAFNQGQSLATQSRHATGDGIASGRPGGIPIRDLIPDVNTGLYQSSLTTPEQVKAAAIQRKRDCLQNPNRSIFQADRSECEAINFLQGQESQREELRFACENLARNKPADQVPPECREIMARPAQMASPYSPSRMKTTEESVIFMNNQSMVDLKQRFNIEQGQFSGCTTQDVVVSPAKYVDRSCTFWDEVEQKSCSWVEPGGSYAQGCGALDSSPKCEAKETESYCVETKRIGQTEVCVKMGYTTHFACAKGNPQPDSSCATEGNQCQPPIVSCNEYIKSSCITGSYNYKCKIEDEKKMSQKNCGNQKFCLSGNCFDTPQPSALGDALLATTTMEAARQAGQYLDGELQIFKGINETCKRKFLKNCCQKGAGKQATSNASVMSQLGFSAASYFGTQAYIRYSPYVFDFMYSNNIFSKAAFSGLESVLTQQAAAANFTSIGSIYGVTAWSGSSTVAPGFMHGWNVPGFGQISNTVTSQFSVGGINFGFDPYSLMFALAIQVLTQLLTCDQKDIETNMHRESRLCTYVGEYCSKKLPIIRVCIEWKKSYCCYNSRLARIISEQGRPMLGKSYGSPQGPDCSGFTPDEFSRLDFSRMNLSEFYSEILPADFPAMSGAFQAHGNRRIGELSQ